MAYLDETLGPSMALVNGVTAGTVTASKALSVDANKDVATLRHLTINGNLVTGTTTLSEADLAKIDGITNGTAAASKALVLDTNRDIGTVRNVTMDGVLVGNLRTIAAKTSAYPIVAADSGKIFTNRGASGSVTFTLPTAGAAYTGVEVTIMAVVAAQDVVIAAQTAGDLIVFNDAAANSVTISTTNEIIGAAMRCICDGTSWLIIPALWEGQTITIAT